ncbi:hypothetical protein SteCoe_23334 [Stentor coeruleus]|uniref:Arf-GAP domain-containing protein n=1 Tax=Stentor coeruleus TaxID=5963 RepID=A0A1R2BK93_9CILI|nr:hypothetical protein SteCoe_23334 [Stentor coeruleus]
MVSSENSEQIFKNLKSDPDNNTCADCFAQNPTFVSINNGCFICQNCLQGHLILGPQVSRVKSLDDVWTEEDLKLVIAGGNSSIIEFFTHYKIQNSPASFKYMTKAGFFYREMLSVVAQDKEYEQNCPGIEEGVQLAGSVYPELNKNLEENHMVEMPIEENKNVVLERVDEFEGKNQAFEGTGIENNLGEEAKMKEEDSRSDLKAAWKWAKGAYNKAVDAGNKTADKISEKINKFAEKPAIKKVEDKTIEYAGKLESGINTLIEKVKNKPAVKDTVEQFSHAADSFSKEVKFTYTKINSSPSVQKLKVDTMNLLKDLASSFKAPPPSNPQDN